MTGADSLRHLDILTSIEVAVLPADDRVAGTGSAEPLGGSFGYTALSAEEKNSEMMTGLLQIIGHEVSAVEVVWELSSKQQLACQINADTIVKHHRPAERTPDTRIGRGEIQAIGIRERHNSIAPLLALAIEPLDRLGTPPDLNRHVEDAPRVNSKDRIIKSHIGA